jgi:hypothetical protein
MVKSKARLVRCAVLLDAGKGHENWFVGRNRVIITYTQAHVSRTLTCPDTACEEPDIASAAMAAASNLSTGS